MKSHNELWQRRRDHSSNYPPVPLYTLDSTTSVSLELSGPYPQLGTQTGPKPSSLDTRSADISAPRKLKKYSLEETTSPMILQSVHGAAKHYLNKYRFCYSSSTSWVNRETYCSICGAPMLEEGYLVRFRIRCYRFVI